MEKILYYQIYEDEHTCIVGEMADYYRHDQVFTKIGASSSMTENHCWKVTTTEPGTAFNILSLLICGWL